MIPDVLVKTIYEDAGRLGAPADFVVATAVWTFSMQDPISRDEIVIDFWHRGLGAVEAMASGPRIPTFKERVYAMVAGCYSSIFRRIAE
jgi:hypothetical protein